MACFKRGNEDAKTSEVVVEKTDGSHQEGKHYAIEHNLDKYVTTYVLLGMSGSKIHFLEIDSTYTRVGEGGISTPRGIPDINRRRVVRRARRTMNHPGPPPLNLIKVS